ncbi:MAG: hypothetical protein RBR38_07075, partial [Desulfomicrobium apsheronum]|nr:hypothetical protein [Desulfomicrobium apsheronum]
LVAYKTLSKSVLFAPTRYLFVKDPLAFRQEETSLSTPSSTVKNFLFLFSIQPAKFNPQRLVTFVSCVAVPQRRKRLLCGRHPVVNENLKLILYYLISTG